jgi:gamma-glutamylcyclotransferase
VVLFAAFDFFEPEYPDVKPSIFYFAYGSNMNVRRLTDRLRKGGETLIERRAGRLDGYKLEFNKVASGDPKVGFANIVAVKGGSIEGVLNRLRPEGLAILDTVEIVPIHYTRITVHVLDLTTQGDVKAYTYVGNPSMLRPDLRPTRDYMAHLIAGEDVLSESYTSRLREIVCW